jgi:beta-phosphoglucomutase-like phosphatase (HAD superfamily)
VVSSSANTTLVLEAAGITGLFEAQVDGVVARERGLPGKPAPDTFLLAARELGGGPADAVVFEDAISGVAAGRAGGFAYVVGVDRAGHAEALAKAGADVVVADLSELRG